MVSKNRYYRRSKISEAKFRLKLTKRRLAEFNGVAKHTFYLHLKETEFRFNHRREIFTLNSSNFYDPTHFSFLRP